MCDGLSLLKCEASVSLRVKVITEQLEVTGQRGQRKVPVLASDYYLFQSDCAPEDTFDIGNIFMSHLDIIWKVQF